MSDLQRDIEQVEWVMSERTAAMLAAALAERNNTGDNP